MRPHPLLVVLLFFEISCKETPPQPPPPTLTLTIAAEDASCTEAWLKVSSPMVPATLALTRDGHRVLNFQLATRDSQLIDEGLIPKRSYTYQLQKLNTDSTVIETSASVQMTTMDTTSHNFTWQIDTLGVTSSVLHDVAIISENDIWAVGELYLNDSTGQLDPILFNAAHWDGTKWNYKRIGVFFRGNSIIPQIYGIYAFSSSDIWLAAGMAIHGDGENWVGFDVRTITGYDTLSFTKCWGESSTDMYFVGLRGSLARYSSGTWQRVESGTTLPIMDVFGARKNPSGQYEILCVAEAYGVPGGSKILSVENDRASELTTSGLESWGVEGIWFVPDRQYFIIGDRVWKTRSPEGNWILDDRLPRLFSTSVRGQALNDYVVGGAFWLLAHNNGASWQTYFPRTSGSFGGVAIKGNLVIAVGDIGNRAVAVQGRR
jgi:hypothetical protein